MRLLLDTHFVLWAATERSQFTQAELSILTDNKHRLLVSAVSIWELRIKWNRRFRSGQRKGPYDPQVVMGALHRLGLTIEPMSGEQCAIRLNPPPDHSDPFDELLLAVAQHMSARLFTRDGALRGHPLAYLSD
ncbi:MAG: type II toxin-antitoxin system VapC family toxin [Novosphingobium sp.]